jgi:hypothetical protein
MPAANRMSPLLQLSHPQTLLKSAFRGLHQCLSDGTLRRRLQRGSLPVLDHIQTGADFISAKNIDNKLNEREQTKGKEMLTRIHKATESRIQTDPRINLMGERVDRVWADPILILRKDIIR